MKEEMTLEDVNKSLSKKSPLLLVDPHHDIVNMFVSSGYKDIKILSHSVLDGYDYTPFITINDFYEFIDCYEAHYLIFFDSFKNEMMMKSPKLYLSYVSEMSKMMSTAIDTHDMCYIHVTDALNTDCIKSNTDKSNTDRSNTDRSNPDKLDLLSIRDIFNQIKYKINESSTLNSMCMSCEMDLFNPIDMSWLVENFKSFLIGLLNNPKEKIEIPKTEKDLYSLNTEIYQFCKYYKII